MTGLAPDLAPSTPPGMSLKQTVLELAEEQIAVSRRSVQGDTVRVSTTTQVRDQQVEEDLAHETITIERVAVGRVVEAAPPVREEGDVTIIPVMEEVLVVERRLILREEIRIKRVRTTEMHRQTVQLREQIATIVRTKPADGVPPSETQQLSERESL